MGEHLLSGNTPKISTSLGAQVAKTFRGFSTLIFPESCPGCGQLDTLLCDRCRGIFLRPPHSVSAAIPIDAGIVKIWTLSVYQGSARKVVLAMKHSQAPYYQELPFFFGATAGKSIAASFPRPVIVCPAPSTFHFGKTAISSTAGRLAAGITSALEAEGVPVRLSGLLELKPGSKKQAGRSFEERLRGRAGSMRLATKADLDFSEEVLLVDDGITTGATIREAVRVINGEQAQVKAVFSFSVAEGSLETP